MVAAGYLQKDHSITAEREASKPNRPTMEEADPELAIEAIMAIIESIGDIKSGIQPSPARALGRVKDLLGLAGECVGLIGSRTNDPLEARFTAMVVKAAINYWQPVAANNLPDTRW